MKEIKDLSNSKSIKVICDFCGKDMECPEEMMETSKKQMCFECFSNQNYPPEELKDVHVDIPMDEMHENLCSEMADRMVNEVFPGMWQEKKEDLKERSKKDLAEEMFGAGVYMGAKAILETLKMIDEKEGSTPPKKE